MDMAAIGSALSSAQTGSELGIKVLKEAQQMQAGSLELIQDLPSPAKSANPPGVGGGIDLSA